MAAAAVVASQFGLGSKTVWRRVVQDWDDASERDSTTFEELAAVRRLNRARRRLRENVALLKVNDFLRRRILVARNP